MFTKMAEGKMTFPLNLTLNFIILIRCYCYVMQTPPGDAMSTNMAEGLMTF